MQHAWHKILSEYAYKMSSGCWYSIHFDIYGQKMGVFPAWFYWHEMSEDGRNRNRNKRKGKKNGKIGKHGKRRNKTKLNAVNNFWWPGEGGWWSVTCITPLPMWSFPKTLTVVVCNPSHVFLPPCGSQPTEHTFFSWSHMVSSFKMWHLEKKVQIIIKRFY